MGYTLTLDVPRRLVKVAFDERCETEEVTRAVTDARAAASNGVLGILYDMRACAPGGMTLADVFWMPRRHPALVGQSSRAVRIAAVFPPHLEELLRFWETTSRNLGMSARAFEAEEEAVAWLTEGSRDRR